MKQAALSDHGSSRGDMAQAEHTGCFSHGTKAQGAVGGCTLILYFCSSEETSAAVAMGKLVLVSGQHNHQAEILKPWCRGFAVPVTLLQFSDSNVTPVV